MIEREVRTEVRTIENVYSGRGGLLPDGAFAKVVGIIQVVFVELKVQVAAQ